MLVDGRKSRVDVGGRDHLSSGEIQSSNLGNGTDGLANLDVGKGKEGDGIPPPPPPAPSSAIQVPTTHANVGMFARKCKSPMCQSVSLPPTVAQQRLPRCSLSVAFGRAASRFPPQGWTWTENEVLLPVCTYTWPSAWWYVSSRHPYLLISPGQRAERGKYFQFLGALHPEIHVVQTHKTYPRLSRVVSLELAPCVDRCVP